MRSYFASLLILIALAASLASVPAAAQVDEGASDDDSGDVVEELVVYATRSGDPTDADPAYKEMMRLQMMDEVQRMRLEEEEDWRNSNLTYQSSQKSRIVWGSDPKTDRAMQEDFERNSLPGDTTKPTTLFRAQF
jgi:hypothetical protein